MRSLKILLVHNRYLIGGGERQIFEAESNLLRDYGHQVETYTEDNQRVAELGHVRTAARTIWSTETYQQIRGKLSQNRFDIVHVHNFFPLISPSIYYAARAENIPVVQTINNFRLMCLNGFLFRDGTICENCVGRSIPWPGIRHACYRDSRGGSATVAAMLSFHRAIGTWNRMVNTYIANTEFIRQKLIESGLPGNKIAIKQNFITQDPGQGNGQGEFALFVGRLSPEKGIDVLLAVWQMMGETIPLKIVGDGPLYNTVTSAAASLPSVDYMGRLDNDRVLDLMREAKFLVFPSLWYENFPVTIIEAYAAGLPVLVSNLGNVASLIEDGQTGLYFKSGDAADLIEKVKWMVQHPEACERMGSAARSAYEQHYTPSQNYRLLRAIYEDTLTNSQKDRKDYGTVVDSSSP
jgi:glycosyltransferase involved in cell wall biosynthesis